MEEKRAAKALALVQVGGDCLPRGRPSRVPNWHLAVMPLYKSCGTPPDGPMLHANLVLKIYATWCYQSSNLDEELFLRTLRSSKRGSAGGFSGMTNEHLRPLLDSTHDAHLLFLAGEQLARAQVPPSIITLVRLGRLTALQKDNGRVRGFLAGLPW